MKLYEPLSAMNLKKKLTSRMLAIDQSVDRSILFIQYSRFYLKRESKMGEREGEGRVRERGGRRELLYYIYNICCILHMHTYREMYTHTRYIFLPK